MSCDIAIKVENVGKRYEIYDAPHHRLFQTFLYRFHTPGVWNGYHLDKFFNKHIRKGQASR